MYIAILSKSYTAQHSTLTYICTPKFNSLQHPNKTYKEEKSYEHFCHKKVNPTSIVAGSLLGMIDIRFMHDKIPALQWVLLEN